MAVNSLDPGTIMTTTILLILATLLALAPGPRRRAGRRPRSSPRARAGYHTYRIPSLIVAPKGTVLAFCEGRKNGRGDTGDIDLVLKRSTDGGKTWGKTAGRLGRRPTTPAATRAPSSTPRPARSGCC